MTQQETVQSIGANTELMDFMGMLYDRWQDEQGLEEWEDYKKVMKEKFKSLYPICSFCQAFQKPFGFSFEVPNTIYQLKVTSKSIRIVEIR
jgi:hypothetical protein